MKRFILIIISLLCLTDCSRIPTYPTSSQGNTLISVTAPAGFDVRDMRILLFNSSDKFVREVSNVQKSLNSGVYTYSMDIAPGVYSMVLIGNSQGQLKPIYSSGGISTTTMYQVDQSASYIPNSPEILYSKILNVIISKDSSTSINSVLLTRNVAMVKLVVDRSQLLSATSSSHTHTISLKNMCSSLAYNGKLLTPLSTNSMQGYFNITKHPTEDNYISDTITFIMPANNGLTATDIAQHSLKVDFSGKRKDGSAYQISDVLLPKEPRANNIMIVHLDVEPNYILVTNIAFKDWNAPISSSDNINTGVSSGKLSSSATSYLKTASPSVVINSSVDAASLIGPVTIKWRRQKDSEAIQTLSSTTQAYTEAVSSLAAGLYTYTREATDRYGNIASTLIKIRYKDPLKLIKYPNNWFCQSICNIAYFYSCANDPTATYSWYKDGVLLASAVEAKKYKIGVNIASILNSKYKVVVSNEFQSVESLPKQAYILSIGAHPYNPDDFIYESVTLSRVGLVVMDRNLGATQVCPDPNSNTPPMTCVGAFFQWAHEAPMTGGNVSLLDNYPDIHTTSWQQGPCPNGFHVINAAEWATISSAYTSNEIRDLLKLPKGGYIETEGSGPNPYLREYGNRGLYWLADPSTNSANAYYFRWDNSSLTIERREWLKKSGFSVRCVADY